MPSFAKYLSSSEPLFACFRTAQGAPVPVQVVVDSGANAVVFDRESNEWAYWCAVDGNFVRLLECFIGTQVEVEEMVSGFRSANLTSQGRQALKALPRLPREPLEPLRESHSAVSRQEQQMGLQMGLGPRGPGQSCEPEAPLMQVKTYV
jgi:hypothetical protein